MRGAGQDVRAVRNMRLRGFRRQRHVAEGADENDIDVDIRVDGSHAVGEAVGIEFAVADFDGSDQADHARFGQKRGQHAVEVAAFIGGGGVAVDVVQAEGILSRAPSERNIGELAGQFLDDGTVLRTVRDHQLIVAGSRPIAQGDRGVVNDVGAVLHVKLKSLFPQCVLNRRQAVVHALAEGEIVDRAWHQSRHAENVILRQGRHPRPSQEENKDYQVSLFHDLSSIDPVFKNAQAIIDLGAPIPRVRRAWSRRWAVLAAWRRRPAR